MCMSTPKAPKSRPPKLPRQPVQQKAASFAPNEDGIGFGQTGRSGGQRGLRIKRQSRMPATLGNLGAGPGLMIGTQVPGA